MVSKRRLYLTALAVGAVCWFSCGTVTGMASFDYAGPIHKNLGGPARENLEAHSILAFEVGGVWAACGALVGLLIMARFLAQPIEAHMTRIPQIDPGRSGPRTQAEMNAVGVALGLGLGASLLLYHLYIKNIELPRYTTVSGASPWVAVIATTLFSCSILPLSLKFGGFRR